MQRYWRFSRGLTLGAQGIIFDKDARILLVRHGYRPGWHFPGGGVERNETILAALERQLFEEVGVVMKSAPKLHGMFTNFEAFPGDHIAVYVTHEWEQVTVPKPNSEIVEHGFFNYNNLPKGISRGTQNRLNELFSDQPISDKWASSIMDTALTK